MLLDYLDVTAIVTKNWYMVELRSERTSEETIKRVGRGLQAIFGQDPVQVFVPVIERDLDTFTLLTECYIFVRSDNPTKIGKLRKITGVQGVMAIDGSTRVTKFIPVEDDYVQGLIQQCWKKHYERALTIRPGSWVRIIDGETRDLCGSVVAIKGDRASIKIDMKAKLIIVDTSIHNLLDMSHIPQAHRVFYYSTPVQEFLGDGGKLAEQQLSCDINYSEEGVKAFLGQEEAETKALDGRVSTAKSHTSREQTATRLITSLIQAGERDVQVLLTKTVEAIRARTIKPPKTATILWHVLRQSVVRHMFGSDPDVRTYTDVVKVHGLTFQVTPKDVLAAIPELPLRPTQSQPRLPKLPVTTLKVGGAAQVQIPTQIPQTGLTVPTGIMDTISSAIRRALEAKDYNMFEVVERSITGIKAGNIRAPKHVESLAVAVRFQVLKYFRSIHPNEDIRALAGIYGDALRVTPTGLREKFPYLGEIISEKRSQQNRPIETISTRVEAQSPLLTIIRRKTPTFDIQSTKVVTTLIH